MAYASNEALLRKSQLASLLFHDCDYSMGSPGTAIRGHRMPGGLGQYIALRYFLNVQYYSIYSNPSNFFLRFRHRTITNRPKSFLTLVNSFECSWSVWDEKVTETFQKRKNHCNYQVKLLERYLSKILKFYLFNYLLEILNCDQKNKAFEITVKSQEWNEILWIPK